MPLQTLAKDSTQDPTKEQTTYILQDPPYVQLWEEIKRFAFLIFLYNYPLPIYDKLGANIDTIYLLCCKLGIKVENGILKEKRNMRSSISCMRIRFRSMVLTISL